MNISENTRIKYIIEDDGKLSHFTLDLKEVESGELYGILHDTERYTCLAKVIKREMIPDDKYIPIACHTYDKLEAAAVKKVKMRLEYKDNDTKKVIEDHIKDFKTENKEEFLILSSGEKIRLDRIIKFEYI